MPVEEPRADADAVAARAAVRLSRSISATWWNTFAGIIFFDIALVFVWVSAFVVAGADRADVLLVAIGGVVWTVGTALLLRDYRSSSDPSLVRRLRRALPSLAIGFVYGAIAGLASGSWLLAAVAVVQMLVLITWPAGVRWRIVVASTLVLVALWVVDSTVGAWNIFEDRWALVGFYATALPVMSALALWWWDVLVALDRARVSESRLAATQERLRVATDVHDLQGHHLQVIALQLELAERLLARDPDAALAHIKAARTSVDDARQGTRDLAVRFRSAALADEIANAVDLLQASGSITHGTVAPDAEDAPAAVFGPVIRETTTNVLRHGGGRWARLSLTRDDDAWRFEIANDPVAASDAQGDARSSSVGGSGLEGIARRAAEAGGSIEVEAGAQEFVVVVRVPVAREGGAS